LLACFGRVAFGVYIKRRICYWRYAFFVFGTFCVMQPGVYSPQAVRRMVPCIAAQCGLVDARGILFSACS
jgi:hypothetical protein